METKKKLLSLLKKGNFKEVINKLSSLGEENKNQQLLQVLSLQSKRIEAIEDTPTASQEYQLEIIKIKKALKQVIDHLPDDYFHNSKQSFLFKISKSKWKRYSAIFIATVAFLAGLAGISGFSIKDFFQKKEDKEQENNKYKTLKHANTSGDISPAIINDDGDVNINYHDYKISEDSTKTKKDK
ncbi:hypothetical protein [Kordia sp.]|uniref:hypothetical protein n=1 Tax=Kordia sp. TaxID=1965332 RepID=UPI003D2D1FE8